MFDKTTLLKFIKELLCQHVYKQEKREFLEKELQINHNKHQVDIDCYDKTAHHMRCIICDATKIQVHNQLVKKVDVTGLMKTWKRES